MRHKLVIDGNAVYEIDDECLKCRQENGKDRHNNRLYRQTAAGRSGQEREKERERKGKGERRRDMRREIGRDE